ncbi:MAG: acyltransferase family protein [Methylococcales bacterium]
MLDGWRGLAALAVLFHHVTSVPIGGRAVMLFFVISGYCITATADEGLRNGVSFWKFLARRIHRIYPPYLLSVLFYISTRIVKNFITGVNQLDRPLIDFVQNATLTQWMTLVVHPIHSPADNQTLFVAAYWSLCYEEQFYLISALLILVALYFKHSLLWPVVTLICISVLWNILIPGLSYGLFIEYWMVFGVGGLVFYRLCRVEDRGLRLIIDGMLAGLAVLSMGIGWASDYSLFDGSRYGDLMFASLFGLLLISIRAFDGWFHASRTGDILRKLGLISYSLYLVHQFNLTVIASAAYKLLPTGAPSFVFVGVQTILHIVLATVFWTLCERPFLNRRLHNAPSVTHSSAAPNESI